MANEYPEAAFNDWSVDDEWNVLKDWESSQGL